MKIRTLVIAGLVLAGGVLLVPSVRHKADSWLRQRDLIQDDAIVDPADLEGVELTEEMAPNFFPSLEREGGRMIYDPLAFCVLRPDRDQWFDFEEHAEGRIRFKTNNLGFREDADTEAVTDAYRILVLGDSHTEGVVYNAESFPNVLERLLDEADDGRRHDVINAAVGTTGPQNYLGMLRKHRELAPDIVIVAFYSGNDFQDAMRLSDFFTKRRTKKRTREYIDTMLATMETWGGRVSQGFNQAYLFRYLSTDLDVAVGACTNVTAEIAALCDELGAELIVAVLPTKVDVDVSDDEQTVQAIKDAMALTDEQYAVNAELANRYMTNLRELGIRTLDLAPAMRAEPEPLFWRTDFHLSVTGHAFLARTLLPECLALIEAEDN